MSNAILSCVQAGTAVTRLIACIRTMFGSLKLEHLKCTWFRHLQISLQHAVPLAVLNVHVGVAFQQVFVLVDLYYRMLLRDVKFQLATAFTLSCKCTALASISRLKGLRYQPKQKQ